MKLIILHGSGLAAAANRLFAIKKNFDPLAVTEINCKEANLGQVLAEIATGQLFFDNRLVILDNLDYGNDLPQIPQDDKLNIVLKFPKTLPANCKLLKSTKNFKPETILLEEKDETSIFPFLDLLGEKNKKAFGELDKYLDEWGGQYVLTMIYYLLRRMIHQTKKLHPFVAKKIEAQKKNFNLEKIVKIYKEALKTDFKIKSGLMGEKLGLTLLVEKIIKM